MKKFAKITNPADVLDTQHFLQLKKVFLIHQDDNNYNKCMRIRGPLFTLRLTPLWTRQSQRQLFELQMPRLATDMMRGQMIVILV